MDNDLVQEIVSQRVLHWNYRGYEVLPVELQTNGSRVEEIYLKMNNLKTLPKWLGMLQSLTNLYVSQNKLERLPKEICEITSLEVLDVSGNNLSELPPTICLLPKLKTLLLMNNKITAFPCQMYMLPSITTINGAGNLIVSIEELCHCRTLEDLYVDNNLILCLPLEIIYMPKLKSLNVCRNNLLYLPSLPFISDIDFSFDHNPSLNYIPYLLGCQITESSLYSLEGQWDLRTVGCSEVVSEIESLPNLKLILPSGEKLVMPLGLKCVESMSGPVSPPTLHELSIQAVYLRIYEQSLHFSRKKEKHAFHMTRTICQKPTDIKSMLTHLSNESRDLLLRGPISICLGSSCKKPIFCHCIAWVIPKYIAYRIRASKEVILSTLLFCSRHCGNSFKEKLLFNEPENWEVEFINSCQPWVISS